MADMNQVVAKLLERTEEKRVPWQKSSQPGMIRATVGDLSVYITSREDDTGQLILLNVLDRIGETVGEVTYTSHQPSANQELISLYENATTFLVDDPRLDDFLEALDAAPPIAQS